MLPLVKLKKRLVTASVLSFTVAKVKVCITLCTVTSYAETDYIKRKRQNTRPQKQILIFKSQEDSNFPGPRRPEGREGVHVCTPPAARGGDGRDEQDVRHCSLRVF